MKGNTAAVVVSSGSLRYCNSIDTIIFLMTMQPLCPRPNVSSLFIIFSVVIHSFVKQQTDADLSNQSRQRSALNARRLFPLTHGTTCPCTCTSHFRKQWVANKGNNSLTCMFICSNNKQNALRPFRAVHYEVHTSTWWIHWKHLH